MGLTDSQAHLLLANDAEETIAVSIIKET